MDLGFLLTLIVAVVIGLFLFVIIGGILLRYLLAWFVVRTVKKVFCDGASQVKREVRQVKAEFDLTDKK